MPVPYLACMALAASIYGLPTRVLPAIHGVEGGAPGVTHLNTDGTLDLGIMQINERWIPALVRYTGVPAARVRIRLMGSDCYNVVAAGWILRNYLDESGGNLMQAIGYYHSHTRPLGLAYQTQVVRAAYRLFSTRRARTMNTRRYR